MRVYFLWMCTSGNEIQLADGFLIGIYKVIPSEKLTLFYMMEEGKLDFQTLLREIVEVNFIFCNAFTGVLFRFSSKILSLLDYFDTNKVNLFWWYGKWFKIDREILCVPYNSSSENIWINLETGTVAETKFKLKYRLCNFLSSVMSYKM